MLHHMLLMLIRTAKTNFLPRASTLDVSIQGKVNATIEQKINVSITDIVNTPIAHNIDASTTDIVNGALND